MDQNQKSIVKVLSSIFKSSVSDKDRKDIRKKLLAVLGFKPKSFEYYELAILHSSAANHNKPGINRHNERLEFLGDSVIDLVIADVLFRKFPDKDEGALTKLRSTIVNRTCLNKIATDIGLDKLIIGNFNKNILPEDVKGNALEALVGAIYLDKGFKFSYAYVKDVLLVKYLNVKEVEPEYIDYKSELFMWSQKHKQVIEFETVGDIGRGDKKKYVINVLIQGKVLGTGEGSSKKKAQQLASKNACKKLNLSVGHR